MKLLRRGTRRMTTNHSRLPREVGGQQVRAPLFLFSTLLFSSSYCSYFPVISFFAKISNRLAEAGRNRADAGGGIDAGETGRGKGYVLFMLFLFSTLFISSSHSSSILIIYSATTGTAGRARAGQDVTGPTRAGTATRDSNEGQDRGADKGRGE